MTAARPACLLEDETADSDALEDLGGGVVAGLLIVRYTCVFSFGPVVVLAGHMTHERWLLAVALGLADSLVVLDLAAPALGALAINLLDDLLGVNLRKSESGVALRGL